LKLVGIDLSTDPGKCGVCVLEDALITYVGLGDSALQHPQWLLVHCAGADVVAIDVPFGWPKPLVDSLASYVIGVPLNRNRRQYQLRTTDLWVKQTLPLSNPKSVSTDKLGSTAIVGTNLLHDLSRKGFGLSPQESGAHPTVIEVYPAASLQAWGLSGMRKEDVIGSLKQKFAFTTSKVNGKTILTNAHCFDALIATLTARAYVDGDTSDPPSDIPCDVLRAEGWIRIPIRGR
jgi:predicted nuclease with RNAse H fold